MDNTGIENNIIYIEIRGIRVTEDQAAEIKAYFKNNFNYIFSQVDWIKDNGIIRGCGQLDSQKVQDRLEKTLKEVAERFEYLEFGLLFTDEPLESYIELSKVAPFKEQWKIKDNIDYEIKPDGTVKLNEYGKRKVLINLVYGGLCDHIRGSLIAEGRYYPNKLMQFIYYDNQTFYDVNIYNDNLHVNWNELDVKYNWFFDQKTSDFGKILNIRGKHIEDKELIKKIRKVSYTEKGETLADYNFINNEGDIYLNTKYSRSWECGEMVIYYDMQRLARQLKSLEMLVVISRSQKDILGTADLVLWICRGKWKVIRDKKLIEKVFRSYENSCKSFDIRMILDLERNAVQVNEYHMGRYDDFVLGWIEYQREKLSKDYMTRFLDSIKNSM